MRGRAALSAPKPSRLGGAGREVLDEDVGAGDERCERGFGFGLAQVQCHRLLAAVDPDEVGRLAVHGLVVATGEVAFGPLDLDHPRAGVGQTAGTVGRCHRLLEGDDD